MGHARRQEVFRALCGSALRPGFTYRADREHLDRRFIAETCCRGCLAEWHDIPKDRGLTSEEREHVAAVNERWLRIQLHRS
ncbi:MAG: DUF4186 family protein [Gemmatimonadaceae bacterium]|nr:DUF4186 family protein [Gemmatimonadaceae bacterium]